MSSIPAKFPAWAAGALRVAAATAVVWLVFGRAVGFRFLLWDDDIQLTHNPTLAQLDWDTAWRMFTHGYAIRYQPLSWLSAALLAKFAGMSPSAFHAYNIALHATSALLLAAFIRHLLARAGLARDAATASWAALFGALLWAVHPLRVEPVVWATGWRYCQSVVLMLASALLYVQATESSPRSLMRTRRYWLSVLAFTLSAFSYPFCLEWPLVLLLLDVYPLRRWGSRSAWLDKLPFAAVSVLVLTVSVTLRLTTRVAVYQPATWAEYGPLGRIQKAFTVWANAIVRTLVPADLSPLPSGLLAFHPLSAQAIAATVALVAITVVLVRARRGVPLLLVLWLSHLVLLLSKLGLLDVHHVDADRYTYPAGIAWGILAALGFLALGRRAGLRRTRMPLAIALLGILGLQSYWRTAIWRDDQTFLPAALADVDHAGLRQDLLRRLALAHWRDGHRDLALALLDDAIALHPTDLRTRMMRIGLLKDLGRADAAYREMSEVMHMTGASTAEEARRIIGSFVRSPDLDVR
jgi:hypothetical protein